MSSLFHSNSIAWLLNEFTHFLVNDPIGIMAADGGAGIGPMGHVKLLC